MINPIGEPVPVGREQIQLTPWASDQQPAPDPERSHDRLPEPAHAESFVRAVEAINVTYKLPGAMDDYAAASTRPLNPTEQGIVRQTRASSQAVPGKENNAIHVGWSRSNDVLALSVMLPSTRLDGFGRPVKSNATLFMRAGTDEGTTKPTTDELSKQPGLIFGLLAHAVGDRAFTTKTRDDYAGKVEAVDPESALGISESYSPQHAYALAPLP